MALGPFKMGLRAADDRYLQIITIYTAHKLGNNSLCFLLKHCPFHGPVEIVARPNAAEPVRPLIKATRGQGLSDSRIGSREEV